MVGTSTDVPQFDLQFNEIGTLTGAGHLVTWNQVSPRVGVNVKVTDDGKTILRAVAGRYYLPLFLGEFEDLNPSRALRTVAGFSAAACPGATIATETVSCFPTILSVTDPNRQVRFDPNTKAPYTDQFAVGMDREIARNVGVGFNVIHKRGGNELGWIDTGGVYGTQSVTITGQTIYGQAVNQTLTVYPLLNSSTQQLFVRTNGPGYYNEYNALILTATRRLANHWQLTAGYTRQRSKGLEPAAGSPGCGAATCGRDPNDFINLDGGLGSRDRPNMFSLMGSYEIPKIQVQLSGNLTAVSGTAIASQTTVRLAQGTRTINLDSPGSVYRTPQEKYMHVRFTKMMFRNGPRRLELTGEIKNALQELGSTSLRSQIFNNANFLVTNTFPEPRQLRLFARWFF